jgi:hypothetical protein
MKQYTNVLVIDAYDLMEIVRETYPQYNNVEFIETPNDTDYFCQPDLFDGEENYTWDEMIEEANDSGNLYAEPWKFSSVIRHLLSIEKIPVAEAYVVRVCW